MLRSLGHLCIISNSCVKRPTFLGGGQVVGTCLDIQKVTSKVCSSTFQPAHRVQYGQSLGSRRAPHSDTAAEFECSLASIQALLAQNCRFLFQDAVSGLAQRDEISSSTRPADPQQSRAPDRFMLMAFASVAYLIKIFHIGLAFHLGIRMPDLTSDGYF